MSYGVTPEKNLYGKYGDPYRVAEFRVFSFNSCGAGCKNCFYLKNNNNYYDFSSVKKLALDLKKNDYTLETLYLLPTDVFENEFNFKVFDDESFLESISLFNYVGLATTLRNGFNREFVEKILTINSHNMKIELHVNLREDLVHDPSYIKNLETNLSLLKTLFGDKVLINLALNLGSRLTREEHEILKDLVVKYSDDKILEMNFTFMFNPNFPQNLKIKHLIDSYSTMQYFSDEFKKTESEYNQRTLLRKPSFTFKDNHIFLSPIIPFDEYVFLDDEFCKLKKPDFTSFIETYAGFETRNTPILKDCETCSNLAVCHGKSFFTLANSLNLPCIKERRS